MRAWREELADGLARRLDDYSQLSGVVVASYVTGAFQPLALNRSSKKLVGRMLLPISAAPALTAFAVAVVTFRSLPVLQALVELPGDQAVADFVDRVTEKRGESLISHSALSIVALTSKLLSEEDAAVYRAAGSLTRGMFERGPDMPRPAFDQAAAFGWLLAADDLQSGQDRFRALTDLVEL